MSRLSASEVIDRGDYLQPDFDPNRLTIPHLLSIFNFHGIDYPSQHTKAKLVALFRDEITPRSNQYLAEKTARTESIASDEGIIDGVTGRLINERNDASTRRYSRRLSREPSLEPQPLEPRTSRSRRSSVEPAAPPRKSFVSAPAEPAFDEREEEEYWVPTKTEDSLSHKTPKARRVSQKFGTGTPDSGWEDDNIFQSGPESSPTQETEEPKPAKKARKSRAPLPPEEAFSPPSRPFSPPSSSSKSPAIHFPERVSVSRSPRLSEISPVIKRVQKEAAYDTSVNDADDEDDVPDTVDLVEESDDIALTNEVSRKLGGQEVAVRTREGLPRRFSLTRILFLALGALFAYPTYEFKDISQSIGFCDTGSTTNARLQVLEAVRRESLQCIPTQGESHDDACPPLPLIPFPEPKVCTTCPVNAICHGDQVTCNKSFILQPHPLALIPGMDTILNGLPGLGPIALPPKCVDDEKWKKDMNAMGRGIASYLAKTRGDRLCFNEQPHHFVDGGDARRWGMELEDLRTYMKQRGLERGKAEQEFEALFKQSIEELENHKAIILSKNSDTRYVASQSAQLDIACKARVATRETWEEYRNGVFGVVAALIAAIYGRGQVARKRSESQQVSSLVQIAVEHVRNQELLHHTDPVQAPFPYVPSIQLRDLLLRGEHSISRRRRLWDQVERVVESNANIRANLEELQGGDEARVWRWIGGGV